MLVAGEAGVGKSALVEQFAGDAPGTCWSWGACDGLFTPRPLGPGSHREAAAQFERALRFAAQADPATVAGLYDELAYEVTLLDRLQDAR